MYLEKVIRMMFLLIAQQIILILEQLKLILISIYKYMMKLINHLEFKIFGSHS